MRTRGGRRRPLAPALTNTLATAITAALAMATITALAATTAVAQPAGMTGPALLPRPAATPSRPATTPSRPATTPRRVKKPARTVQDPCGNGAATPGQLARDVPWQQGWLDPERVRPFATGAGQTVAVIDSGTDGRHPQLLGQVAAGYDLLRDVPHGNVDCLSHGTAVASLITAREVPGLGLRGLAPGARILPIRVTDVDPATDPDGPRQPAPGTVAKAIRWATAHGATVIDVSPAFPTDVPELRSAVQAALAAGIVVVAAAGDRHDPGRGQDPATYPAGYPGVIGVGSVDQMFLRAPSSDVGPHVLVTAPGDGVVAATRLTGHQVWSGTSVAAAFVAGTAALIRQSWPQLGPSDVAARIAATADPAPGGQHGPQYGYGIVDPYRAVTEQLTGRTPATVPGLPAPHVDPVAQARHRWWERISRTALLATGAAVLALVLLTAAALILPRGRARGWRPARTRVAVHVPTVDVDAARDDRTDLFALPTRSRDGQRA